MGEQNPLARLARHQHEPVGLVEVSSVAAGEEDSARGWPSPVVMVAPLGSGIRRGEPVGLAEVLDPAAVDAIAIAHCVEGSGE